MKYEAPFFEITEVEASDIIASSSDIEVVENANGGVNYSVDFTKLFG